MKNFCFLGVLLSISLNSYGQAWNPVIDTDTYRNPIIHADYSDPDVVRVGDAFFMTASSFNATPGLPILYSNDMIHWKLINHALPKQIPEEVFQNPQHGKGVWAPSIRFHNDTFYIYWGDPDFGIYMVQTKDPFGTWEKPVLVLPGKGLIDPCPLWDENGNAYLVHAWAGSRAGVKSLVTINKMSYDGTKVLDEGMHVYDGHMINPTVEGTKFYKRNGYYYIFAPAGGVEFGWQLVLRSKQIYGPYEVKRVLEQGRTNTNGPHQGAWVTAPNGTDWFYHFQDKGPYGRIVHLQPVKWVDNWPVMGIDVDKNGIGEPVESFTKPIFVSNSKWTPQTSDYFEEAHIGLQWQWNANPSIKWYTKLPGNDFLRLFPFRSVNDNLLHNPNVLLQKFPAPNFVATTKMELTPENNNNVSAGLIVMGYDYSYVAIHNENNQFYIRNYLAMNAQKSTDEQLIFSKKINTNTVWLRVRVVEPNARCTFSYSLDGEHFTNIENPFDAKEGGWIGAKIGLFCTKDFNTPAGGFADVEFLTID